MYCSDGSWIFDLFGKSMEDNICKSLGVLSWVVLISHLLFITFSICIVWGNFETESEVNAGNESVFSLFLFMFPFIVVLSMFLLSMFSNFL